MNIAEYLKNSQGNAWLMNDDFFMIWAKEKGWVVKETAGEALKHKTIYKGNSLSDAINAMRSYKKQEVKYEN